MYNFIYGAPTITGAFMFLAFTSQRNSILMHVLNLLKPHFLLHLEYIQFIFLMFISCYLRNIHQGIRKDLKIRQLVFRRQVCFWQIDKTAFWEHCISNRYALRNMSACKLQNLLSLLAHKSNLLLLLLKLYYLIKKYLPFYKLIRH